VVAGLDQERNIHIVNVERYRADPAETVKRLFAICAAYDPHAVLIDNDPAAKVFTRLLYEFARREGKPIPLYPMPLAGKDKETRAAAMRAWFLQGIVHIVNAPWTAELLREIHEFPSGQHDDQIDCLSLIGRNLASASAPTPPAPPPRPPTVEPWTTQGDDGRWYMAQPLDKLLREHEQEQSRRRKRI
jgi:predicted phage terminase large subunit-like protein